MTTIQLFQLIEILNLIITSWGSSIAWMAWVDAGLDIKARKAHGTNGRMLLISTKNLRIAWVLGILLVFQTIYFSLALMSPPTLSQQFPDWLVYIGFTRLSITDCLLTFLVFFNYRDYRKALDYIRIDESNTVVTTTTIRNVDVIPVLKDIPIEQLPGESSEGTP